MVCPRSLTVAACAVALGGLIAGRGLALGRTQGPATAIERVSFSRRAWWSLAKVMRLIDGARIVVGGRRLRIDSEATLCSGAGRAIGRVDARRWHAFDCTYSTLTGGIDRDVDFHVAVLGQRRYRISHAHWIGETR
jgi:hypothetical protein